ncbi:hypothetical protein YC2023_106103 [Brassica napus]
MLDNWSQKIFSHNGPWIASLCFMVGRINRKTKSSLCKQLGIAVFLQSLTSLRCFLLTSPVSSGSVLFNWLLTKATCHVCGLDKELTKLSKKDAATLVLVESSRSSQAPLVDAQPGQATVSASYMVDAAKRAMGVDEAKLPGFEEDKGIAANAHLK